jgi:hypothetical protein
LVEALGMSGVSKSQVSRLCARRSRKRLSTRPKRPLRIREQREIRPKSLIEIIS